MKKLNILIAALGFSFCCAQSQTLKSVSPNTASAGTSGLSITIYSAVSFSATNTYQATFSNGTTNISASDVMVTNDSTLTAVLSIPANANIGSYSLLVSTGSTSWTLNSAFTVTGANGVITTEADMISVYPDPAIGMLYINNSGATEIADIKLLASNGQVVLQPAITGANIEQVDLSSISSGIYILSLTDRSGGVSNRKIAVQ